MFVSTLLVLAHLIHRSVGSYLRDHPVVERKSSVCNAANNRPSATSNKGLIPSARPVSPRSIISVRRFGRTVGWLLVGNRFQAEPRRPTAIRSLAMRVCRYVSTNRGARAAKNGAIWTQHRGAQEPHSSVLLEGPVHSVVHTGLGEAWAIAPTDRSTVCVHIR